MTHRGQTLLEVLIALLILLLVTAGGFFAITAIGSYHGGKNRNRLVAVALCMETAEQLRSFVADTESVKSTHAAFGRYQDPHDPSQWALQGAVSPASVKHVDPLPPDSDLFIIGGVKGERYYTVQDIDLTGDGIAEYKKVVVTVKWYEPENAVTP